MDLATGKMLKVYIDETQKYNGKLLYDLIVKKLKDNGVSTAIVYRSIEGFNADRIIHTAHILDVAIDLPVIIEAIGETEIIDKAIESISPIVSKGIILTADVKLIEKK